MQWLELWQPQCKRQRELHPSRHSVLLGMGQGWEEEEKVWDYGRKWRGTGVTLRLRVVSTWNGWICFFSRSQATASVSRMKDVTDGSLI